MKYKIYAILTVAVVLLTAVETFADYKIKQRMTMSGQTMENTVYVKGSRKRTETSGFMGMGADVATVEQCDRQQTIQLNDGKKLYFVQSFANSSDATNNSSSQISPSTISNQKGGTVTLVYEVTDTGERKNMFGLTARHIKTVMTMQASPDACTKDDMRMETDGWYVDLPQFSCPLQPPTAPMTRPQRSGCQDKMIVKQIGGGKIGFPLILTQTFGDTGFSQTIETVEFSSATLDATLFDVPKDYTLAKSSQELYGRPDMNAMMQSQSNNRSRSDSTMSQTMTMPNTKAAGTKKPGMIRVGVLAVSNKTSEIVSGENLRSVLVERLTGGNVEAVAINSEADAKAMLCDYVLAADVSKLKQSAASKVGGLFGKVTGTDTSSVQKFDTQIDFKLTNPAQDGAVVLQNKAAQKAEGSAETAAGLVLSQVARAVLDAVSRKN